MSWRLTPKDLKHDKWGIFVVARLLEIRPARTHKSYPDISVSKNLANIYIGSLMRSLGVEIATIVTSIILCSAELLERHLSQLVGLQDEIIGVGFSKL